MSKIKTCEEVVGLFQTWPTAFSARWRRNLSKDELYEILEQKLHDAQLKEIRDKFFDWDVESVLTALIFLDENQIEKIDEPTQAKKFKTQKFKKV